MQELAEKIWSNERFHDAAQAINKAWLNQQLFLTTSPASIDPNLVAKGMIAATVLALSPNLEHRGSAFRLSTCGFDLLQDDQIIPSDTLLRVALARLGNFPSIQTKPVVDQSLPLLPWNLAAEELHAIASHTAHSADGSALHLTDFQYGLWRDLEQSKSVALCAPTSAGKSFVLQNYLVKKFSEPKASVIYLVPTRALISQVARDFSELVLKGFDQKDRPEVVTIPIESDVPLPFRGIYVLTQERAQLLINEHPEFSPSAIIVDEAQSIADGARGILLQSVLDDLLRASPNVQILFASPLVRNLSIFKRLFGLERLNILSSVEPTVAQNFIGVDVVSSKKGRIDVSMTKHDLSFEKLASLEIGQTLASKTDKLLHISTHFGRGQSNIIYANGPAEAEKVALLLADYFSDREPTEERLALAALAKESVHGSYVLGACVLKGIGFHYSSIPTALRQEVEAGFANGTLDYLVCTSTLLQGVNLPAKNIFLHSPEKGQRRPLQSGDFWNLSGRAGRLRREFHGNIFLIDYEKWKSAPLKDAKQIDIVPAIEESINSKNEELINVIRSSEGRGDRVDLESAFVRLLSDFRRGSLEQTLDRSETIEPMRSPIVSAIESISARVTLPIELIRRASNISAHKQQALYQYLNVQVDKLGENSRRLVPAHPRESDAYKSYETILRVCHTHLLHLPEANRVHRLHALIARKWMIGTSLPQIISDQLKQKPTVDPRRVIRDTLSLIENDIRFQTLRLLTCYTSILEFIFRERGQVGDADSIPSIGLYLEVGASDRTMISFISLGLSRTAARILNDLSSRKDLDPSAALFWLRNRNLSELGLSPLLLKEVQKLVAS